MITRLVDRVLSPLVGDKRANSETRHRPKWWPHDFDKRWLGERLAVMSLPPYKPPYRRHIKVKAWVCTEWFTRHAIAEVDLDERSVEVDFYK